MMNKRVLNSFLYGTLLFSLGTGVVSCKDYDSDIEGLNNRITTVESDMDRFKEKIEAALNANLTVQSWYPSEDQSQYTIVLSNGDELYVQASNKATPFYQFKVEEGTWRYTKDKGAGWYKVLTFGTEQEFPEQTKTNCIMTRATVISTSRKRKDWCKPLSPQTRIHRFWQRTKRIKHFPSIYTAKTIFFPYKVAVSAVSVPFSSKNNSCSKKMNSWKQPATPIRKAKWLLPIQLPPSSRFYLKTLICPKPTSSARIFTN